MPTPARSDPRLTYEDFLLFPDDGKRHEIIDGVHYVTPSPRLIHQQLLGRLHLAIAKFLEDRPKLQVVTVHRRADDGRFPRVQQLGADATLTTPVLPEFSLSISRLFR